MEAKKGEKRRLTQGEISMANRVFNGVIELGKVRIHDYPNKSRGSEFHIHTVGNDIHCPTDEHYFEDFSQAALVDQATLIHELVHVWQNQSKQRHALSHNKYHDYIDQVDGSIKEYLKHRDLWRNYRDRQIVFDEVGGPLAATYEPSPAQLPTRISARQIDGSIAVKNLPAAPAPDPIVRYMRNYSIPNMKFKNGTTTEDVLRNLWGENYHYNYLLNGSDKIVFAGLTREGQATMIMDYFVLLSGGNPMNPIMQGKLPAHVPHGWQERPDIEWYKGLIPFVPA